MERPGLVDATPISGVTDLAASLGQDTGVPGLQMCSPGSDDAALAGGAPSVACVGRGDVTPFVGHPRRGVPGAWPSLQLDAPHGVDAIGTEYFAQGATILHAPTDTASAMREMLVADPDGSTLRIDASTEEA